MIPLAWFDPVPERKIGAPGKAIARLHELAQSKGWTVTYTVASGPPVNMAMRLARGARRAYAIWHLDGGVRFKGGAQNIIPGGVFAKRKDLETYIEQAGEE